MSIVPNPDGSPTQALRVASRRHTDGTVIRPTDPLPPEYRICADVGYADFGDGKAGTSRHNGYLGGESSEPWLPGDATLQNGFYWLAIVDALPRPRNNVWLHHHRKVVIDSDNNVEAWTSIWNGEAFAPSGEHPVMMFGIAREGPDHPENGKPFLSFAAGALQPLGAIRAVDAYLEATWYRACIERTRDAFTLSTSGRFQYGGEATYVAVVPASRVYEGDARPEYFLLGDPHVNFYRGKVHYRRIRLEVPR